MISGFVFYHVSRDIVSHALRVDLLGVLIREHFLVVLGRLFMLTVVSGHWWWWWGGGREGGEDDNITSSLPLANFI